MDVFIVALDISPPILASMLAVDVDVGPFPIEAEVTFAVTAATPAKAPNIPFCLCMTSV